VATSDTFTFASSIESRHVEGTSWAPDVALTKPANKGTLYWRVAAADNRSNLNPYVEGSFARPRAARRRKLAKFRSKRLEGRRS
jgi:hypothetical protein